MKSFSWRRSDQVSPLSLPTGPTKMLLTLTVFFALIVVGLDAAFSQSYRHWNEDDGITGWDPNWFSSFKYSQPIGIRNRGYLYKRLNRQKWNAFVAPPLLVNPFGRKEKSEDFGNAVSRLRLPAYTAGKKALGWYSGPGSSYHLLRRHPEPEPDDQDLEHGSSLSDSEELLDTDGPSTTSRERVPSPMY